MTLRLLLVAGLLAAANARAQSPAPPAESGSPLLLGSSVATQVVTVAAPLVLFTAVAIAAEDNDSNTATQTTTTTSTTP